jgi:hypothetical protein
MKLPNRCPFEEARLEQRFGTEPNRFARLSDHPASRIADLLPEKQEAYIHTGRGITAPVSHPSD